MKGRLFYYPGLFGGALWDVSKNTGRLCLHDILYFAGHGTHFRQGGRAGA